MNLGSPTGGIEEKSKKPKRKSFVREREVHHDDGEGNWLVSYADMMTLLFGFFVILNAFSTPDAAKIEKLKKETAKSMGVEYSNPYEKLADSLKNILKDFNLDKEVMIQQVDDGLALVSKGTLFFESGSTALNPKAQELVEKIADILVAQAKNFRVVVEGHTDDTPIVSKTFPSNWELSSSRASTVVRLLESKGFTHDNLRPVGLADTQPIVPNRDSSGKPNVENQAQNRRIVIRVQKQLPARMSNSDSSKEMKDFLNNEQK